MHPNCSGLKTWAVLAAIILPLVARADSDIESSTSPPEWRGPVSSRQDSVKAMTNRPSRLMPGGPGRLGLVVSGAPEGVVVERVVIGGPAWQAGVHAGDIIVAADAIPLARLAMPMVAQHLRGPVDSEVQLTLRRPGQRELLNIKPKRAVVPPPKDIIRPEKVRRSPHQGSSAIS